MSDDKLTPLREHIDAIDTQILDLLSQRAGVAQEVGHIKAETNAPVFRPEREMQVLRNVAERNPGPAGRLAMCRPSSAKSCRLAVRWKSA